MLASRRSKQTVLEWRRDDKRGAEKTAGLAAEDPSARAEGERQVAKTCRYYGISRKTFYKWRKRYEAEGPTGLCDRHRRPHRSPSSRT
jgi:hypothetical protein